MKRGLKPNQIRRNEYINKMLETDSFQKFLAKGQTSISGKEYDDLKVRCIELWDVPKPEGFFGSWSFQRVSDEYFRKALKSSNITYIPMSDEDLDVGC